MVFSKDHIKKVHKKFENLPEKGQKNPIKIQKCSNIFPFKKPKIPLKSKKKNPKVLRAKKIQKIFLYGNFVFLGRKTVEAFLFFLSFFSSFSRGNFNIIHFKRDI